jgi:hypothetical protein
MWAVIFIIQPVFSQERSFLSVGWEAGLTPEPVSHTLGTYSSSQMAMPLTQAVF